MLRLTWCVPIWLWCCDGLPSADSGAEPPGLRGSHHSERPLGEPGRSAGARGHHGGHGLGGQRCVGLAVVVDAIGPGGSPVNKSGHRGRPALLRLVVAVPLELPPGSE